MGVKATFTLDEETAGKLAQTAERLQRSKSEIVREAILDYSERAGRLSERERARMLRAFDDAVARIPQRPPSEVDEELTELRDSRRRGGRRDASSTP